jgi:Polyketide cyclase / dehydrase and lipid transport
MRLLQKNEELSASTEVRASADEVYAVISDVLRIPEWSPETVRVERMTASRFQAWNRRRFGRWHTVADVVAEELGRRFSFVVQAMGADWTQWTYVIEPGATAGVIRLTEVFRMCIPMPLGAVFFEYFFLLVPDRRRDLQDNLDRSVDRIRAIVEAGAAG